MYHPTLDLRVIKKKKKEQLERGFDFHLDNEEAKARIWPRLS